jgi:hypothetical protein
MSWPTKSGRVDRLYEAQFSTCGGMCNALQLSSRIEPKSLQGSKQAGYDFA